MALKWTKYYLLPSSPWFVTAGPAAASNHVQPLKSLVDRRLATSHMTDKRRKIEVSGCGVLPGDRHTPRTINRPKIL